MTKTTATSARLQAVPIIDLATSWIEKKHSSPSLAHLAANQAELAW